MPNRMEAQLKSWPETCYRVDAVPAFTPGLMVEIGIGSTMARHIKNAEVEILLHRGHPAAHARRVKRLLRERIWPQVPEKVRGKAVTKAEEAEILGYGKEGF